MPIPYVTTLSDDDLFPYLNFVLVGWALLAFLPAWRMSTIVAKHIAILYAVVYVALMVNSMAFDKNAVPAAKLMELFSSLDGLKTLFSQKATIFAAWTHFVVFDLWTGIWIVEHVREKKDSIVLFLIMPFVMFLTLMFGPTGLLLYFFLEKFFMNKPQIKTKEV